MLTSAILSAKIFKFFRNFMLSPHGQRGEKLSQRGHFAGKGEGFNFLRFCADIFYGWPLKSDCVGDLPSLYHYTFLYLQHKAIFIFNAYFNR